ncbi:phage tail family protein [Bacillus sp. 1813sda1]|uniref:distal tail protein Dit n=1 Tax=unclassified Bacillus (in: firmicutes) TaxID=185979 RepID=UPI0020A1D2B8|nr:MULTISPECIES: distal tail protein Dit [unclassified Bacillus (in: firmicutes)]MCP1164795.1 phage tail family protein [Bacillus sp. 1813sda1]MDC7971719.1 phage tail family protein [Bacillus sp. BLCC-B18]
MSSFTFNNERKDFIQIAKGWKRPAWAPLKRNFLSVPGYPGARLLNTQTEMRVLSIPVGIIVPDGSDLEIIKEEIADWLITEQPAELTFDVEPYRTYLAVVDDSFDPDEFVTLGIGTIKFVCPIPYKLGKVKTHTFTQSWSTEITSEFTNKGSVEAPALIEMTVKEPSTFLDVWFGKYPLERNYFRIGYPLTVEETTVQERERVLWDEMASPIGWTPVTGQVEEMKGTGSFKVKDGHALYCEKYGEEGTSGFYGAIAKKNIPGGPLQDFEMETWITLQSKSIAEMGRVEVLLLDEASNVVARINMNDLYDNAEITKAYMRIGNNGTPNSIKKLVDTSGGYSTTFNQFRGRLRIARRGKQWSVYVAKFIDGTYTDGASLVEQFNDVDNSNPMTTRKIAQVMIAVCKWDNHPAIDNMCITDLKIWKVNKVPSNTKPYIFDTGDKVIIDTERSLVTINGKDAINIKDIFSEFPKIIRGDNRIDIMPPDVRATISYRERYR